LPIDRTYQQLACTLRDCEQLISDLENISSEDFQILKRILEDLRQIMPSFQRLGTNQISWFLHGLEKKWLT